jgi:hypothetical protein
MSDFGPGYGRSDIIDIACVLLRQTERAYCIDAGIGEDVWVPKSLCEWDSEVETMAMPEWLAMERGLI